MLHSRLKNMVNAAAFFAAAVTLPAATIDTLQFGDSKSENAHAFSGAGSIVTTGGLGEKARVIQPPERPFHESAPLTFKLKVDPRKQNYFTAKFWGDDINENLLILKIDGKQFGYRHLGDYDILDHGSSEPQFPERFFYVTSPIPLSATKGKQEIEVELRATGRIWGYGSNFEKYQKNMEKPARGLYKFFIHDEPFFTPDPTEKQGAVPIPVAAPTEKPDFSEVKNRVEKEVRKFLRPKELSNQMRIEFLAKAYSVKWSSAYRNKLVPERIVAGLDELFRQFRKNPDLARKDRSTWNPGWFGFGPAAHAIFLLREEISPRLDETISDGKGQSIKRRDAWAEMLKAGVNHLSTNRRYYTNQSIIIDTNLHISNRMLNELVPGGGLPDAQTLGYLKEAIGLRPWSGSLESPGGKPSFKMGKDSLGRDYCTVTAKGLTKELGYVGKYGEIIDLVTLLYDVTRSAPGAEGDSEIKAALEKMIQSRSYFRYPSLSPEKHPVMRMETVVGWRDHAIGEITYAQRPSREADALNSAVVTGNPEIQAMARQMLDDNQFFRSLRYQLDDSNKFRCTIGMMHAPENYETIASLPKSQTKLPMTPGQPDFVFADEENGVVAIKYGDEILYASLYWRARNAVNFLGKVHYLTPQNEWIATTKVDVRYTPSGLTYTRKNWTNFGFRFGGTHIHYPDEKTRLSLHAGEVMPVAKLPENHVYNPSADDPYAGRGDFYRLSYGPYEIALNMSKEKTFSFTVPGDSYKRLPDGKAMKDNATLEVKPGTTVVLRRIQ